MKNYKILIVVLAVVVVAAIGAFTFSVINSNSAQEQTYADGYILVGNESYSEKGELVSDGSVAQVHFTGGTRIRPVYPNRVEIKSPTNGKTVIESADFLYYEDYSLSSFADGVILQITEDGLTAPAYYNVPALTLLRKATSGYLIDNNGTPITLTNFIWKVSDNVFLISGSNIVAHLNKDVSLNFERFVKVSFVDDGVVEFMDAGGVWFSISDSCSITFGDGIAVDFNAKTITYLDDTAPISIDSMVIGATENMRIADSNPVGIIPTFEITTIDGDDGEQGEQGKQGADGIGGRDGSSGASGTQGGTGGGGSTGEAINIPKFRISDWELSPSTASGTISIEDDDGLLTSDITLELRLGGNEVPIASEVIDYGLYNYNFSFDSLQSGLEYRLTATASYSIGAKTYVREFINKVFRTDDIGISLVKDLVKTDEITYAIRMESYSKVSAAQVELLNPDGSFNTRATVDLVQGIVRFTGLNPDSEYTARLVDVVYDFSLTIPEFGEPCTVKTLKQTPNIGTLQVLVNQKNSTFEAMLTKAAFLDRESGVEKFVYTVYDTNDEVIKQITSLTSDSVAFIVDNVDTLFRQTPYYIEVAAHFYDNEKTVVLTSRSSLVTMSGTQYPSVRFVADTIAHESISGTVYIDLYQSLLDVSQTRPLHITYRNSLGDSITITFTDSDSWTQTGTVIAIPFDVNNLRKDDTYTISVYGHIDLNDGNGYVYQYIGSAVVDTINPTPVTAVLSVNAADVNHAISVLLSFESFETDGDNAFEMSTAEVLLLSLYEGDDTTGVPIASTSLYDTNNNPYQSDFLDSYFETGNTIVVTEETFGVSLSDLTATSYTIKVTSLSDYTSYANTIPVVNNTISLRKTESAPPLPDNLYDALIITIIDNGSLPKYGRISDPNYLSGTTMGFTVRAKYDNGNKKAVTFTYAIYDVEQYAYGNIIPIATVTLPVVQSGVYYGTVPTLNILFGSGTPYWNEAMTVYTVFTDGLTYNALSGVTSIGRGRDYYFTYTAELKLNESHGENGNPYYIYPDDYRAGVILRSISTPAPFESASISMYPFISDETSTSWMISVTDPDSTLIDDVEDGIPMFSCSQEVLRCKREITIAGEYSLVVFDGLTEGAYTVTAQANDYLYPGRAETLTLLDYYFEGVVGYQYSAVTYQLINEPDLNRITFIVVGNESNLHKTAGIMVEARVTATPSTSITKYLAFETLTLNGNLSSGIAYLSYADIAALSGNDVTFRISGLCDNGIAGFSLAGEDEPFAIQQMRRTGVYSSYKVVYDVTQTLYDLGNANGSIFEGTFSGETKLRNFEYSSLMFPNSSTIQLNLTREGARINGTFEVLTLKKLQPMLLNCTTIDSAPHIGNQPEIFLGAILPTVNLMGADGWRVINHIDNAEISLTLNGHQTGSITGNTIYIELYDSNNEHIGDYPITVSTDISEYYTVIEDLTPGASYRFMIYANIYNGITTQKEYLFDAYYQRSTGVTYRINTLGSFTSSIDSITFAPIDYASKTLNVDFTLGEVVGYKLFFNIYRVDTDELDNQTLTLWLDHDAMSYYGLLPNFANYSESMSAAIRWNPADFALLQASTMPYCNPLTTGYKYQLKISAYAPDDSGEYTILLSEAFKDFALDDRIAPIFGTTVLPSMDSDSQHALTFTVSAIDTDRVIVDGEYRVRFFDAIGNDITPEQYRMTAGNVPVVFSIANVNSFVLSSDTLPEGITLNEASAYTICFYAAVDVQNDGLTDELEQMVSIKNTAYDDLTDPIFTVTETTLDNSGIKLGDISVAAGATSGRIRLYFNNSVNLTTIASIQYSVYSSSGHTTFPLVTESFVPSQHTNASGTFYTFDLRQVSLSTSDTYYIIAYFYNSAGVRIGTAQLSYNY